MIKKMGGDEEDARDAFQDAVMVFYRKAKLNELNENTEIAGYIYVLCRNKWLTKVKRENRKGSLEDVNFEPASEDDQLKHIISEERQKAITDIFSQLGKSCEELLLNKFYHNLSMKEIAEKMGFKNEDSAKTQHYKCKQALTKIAQNNSYLKNLFYDVAE